MREIRTSGSMSGDGKRGHGRIEAPPTSESWRQQPLPGPTATAPILDSTDSEAPESPGDFRFLGYSSREMLAVRLSQFDPKPNSSRREN